MRKSVVIGLGMLLGFATAWANDGGVTASTRSATSEAAAKPGSTQASAGDIERLIEQLGGETSAGRDAAQQELVKIGPPAAAALRAATTDKDPERAVRANRALEGILRYERIPETVSHVLLKTYMLGKRAPIASPPGLGAEEFLEDIATDGRIAELLQIAAKGSSAERSRLKEAVIAAMRQYVDDLPETIGPTESLREAYSDFVDEFHAAGDPHVAGEWDEVHGDFSAFVRRLRNHAIGVDLPEGWVPASTYWLVREGRVVGACGLRHRLTESLRDFGGHVCYGVRPSERHKGHGTFMLRAMLDKAKAMGIGRVLVTCDARNIASTGVIAKCGGVMESESHSQGAGRITRKYWIDLQDVRPAEPCQ